MANAQNERRKDKQVLYVFCGLPGQGKSTYAALLVQLLRSRNVSAVVVNQDSLGSRYACECAAHNALSSGTSAVIIDRTNFDAQQRMVWIEVARQHDASLSACEQMRNHPTDQTAAENDTSSMSELAYLRQQKSRILAENHSSRTKSEQPQCNVLIIAILFDGADLQTCISRVKARETHPTLDAERANEVINRFANVFHPPKRSEGFHQVLLVRKAPDMQRAVAKVERMRTNMHQDYNRRNHGAIAKRTTATLQSETDDTNGIQHRTKEM